jgi:hypothetical protein
VIGSLTCVNNTAGRAKLKAVAAITKMKLECMNMFD